MTSTLSTVLVFLFSSYVHENVSLQFLTCEPNLSNIPDYTDEADVFYANPPKWLNTRYGHRPDQELPTHLVMFEVLGPHIRQFLDVREGVYQHCAKLFHTHVPDGRVGSHVLVLCRADWLYPNRRSRKGGRTVSVDLPPNMPQSIKMW